MKVFNINTMKTKGSAMKTNTNDIYLTVKDPLGNDYLCPLEAVSDSSSVSDEEFDECVEKDVVERYSGNIEINRQ
jgi:hypothetical protein